MAWETTALMAWGAGAAAYDARQRRLPNALTLGGVLTALVYLAVFHRAPTGATIGSSMVAAAFALALTLPAYATRWVGGGDVKLALAMALLGGTRIFLVTIAIGGLLLVVFAAYAFHSYSTERVRQRILPYGTAHGIGFAIAVAAAGSLPGGAY